MGPEDHPNSYQSMGGTKGAGDAEAIHINVP